MARSYAQVYLTIWNDPDFRGCSAGAQWLYFVMLTHPSLTSCGVMDWRESRLVNMAEGVTVPRLQHAAWELGQKRLIAIDPDTEEGLVRSFVRHDGVLKSPNLTKGMVREYGGIASKRIMELVSVEVRRALVEDPSLKGSQAAQPVAKQFVEPFRIGSPMVPDWFQKGSESVRSETPQKRGNPSESVPLSLNPQPLSPTDVGERAASHEAPTPPKQDRGKKGTRITAEWMPTQSVIDTLRSEYPDFDLRSEHADFVDYWLAKPGQAGLKLDWDATWRRWMRKNAKEAHEKQANRYRNQDQIVADNVRGAQQRDAQREALNTGSARALIEGTQP